jgi:hypothetical protein
LRHIDWEDIPAPVRVSVEARTGGVRAARTATAGVNSELATVLDTDSGTVFIKGLPADHRGAAWQRREAAINPYVRSVAPALLWHDITAGWDMLAFESIDGARHADYAPGSPDLDRVVAVMRELAAIGCPDLPELRHAPQRWARYTAPGDDPALLDGGALLHTDITPLNILISPSRTHLIDWAWPTTGAAFIDPACLLIRAIVTGHDAEQAEALAARCPGWADADPAAIDVFARVNVNLWDEIARDDPRPWKLAVAQAARDWTSHRRADCAPA